MSKVRIFASLDVDLNLIFSLCALILRANGLRYPRVGGRRERHFAGTNSKPRKLPKNAATPTRRVHAVLGNLVPTSMQLERENRYPHAKFLHTTPASTMHKRHNLPKASSDPYRT
jgi:hypothetical protein